MDERLLAKLMELLKAAGKKRKPGVRRFKTYEQFNRYKDECWKEEHPGQTWDEFNRAFLKELADGGLIPPPRL